MSAAPSVHPARAARRALAAVVTFARATVGGAAAARAAVFDTRLTDAQIAGLCASRLVAPTATVPEPSTVALVAGGLAAVGAAARRRRARA